MRKILPVILIGVGAFLITMGLLFRFYAVPRLAVVPTDQNTRQTVLGPNSTFFDVETLSIQRGTLTSVATIIGDPEASAEASKQTGRDLAVWDKGQSTDNNDTDPPMEASEGRIVFDRYTGEAVDCCGATQDGAPMTYKGQLVKWPFFTEKKTYQYWDGTTKAAYDAEFKGVETIQGLEVYRFEQQVPRTKTEDREVPAKIFGLPDRAMMAERFYENHRTFWVEPVTGVMIKLTEKQYQTLEIPGAAPVVAVDTESSFTDETVSKNVADYATKATLLSAIKTPVPIAMVLLGLISLLGGIAMALLSGRRDQDTDAAWDDEPVDARA